MLGIGAAFRAGGRLATKATKKVSSIFTKSLTKRAMQSRSAIASLIPEERVIGASARKVGGSVHPASVSALKSKYRSEMQMGMSRLPKQSLLNDIKNAPANMFGMVRHPATIIGVGALAMTSVGIMRGINDASRDIMFDRYLRDTRFSRNTMHNTRIGRSSGMNSMLNYGGINGLATAMHRTRHGR